MSEPLWMQGDPIALGTDEEDETDLFDGADAAFDSMMEDL